MARVVGVRFKTAGKVYYFDPGDLELGLGEGVVVETARGVELGTVATRPREVPDEEVKPPLKKVLRKAQPADFARRAENEEKAQRAFTVGQQKIAAHGLPMKLVHVEYTLDGSKIVFYFTAENRVDFRELVKDLASTFRTRIELRQIGVRDEAKLLGGLGPCGRQLCCQAFLGDFVPVSIRMAKEQNLSLNPTKISGICGRLMCCLNFESEAYREAKRAEKAAEEAASVAAQAAQAPVEAAEQAETAGEAVCTAVCPVAEAGECPRAADAAGAAEPEQAAEGTASAVAASAKKRRRRRRRPTGDKAPGEAQAPKGEPEPGGTPAQGPGTPGQGRSNHRRRRRRGSRPGARQGNGGSQAGNPGGSPAE